MKRLMVVFTALVCAVAVRAQTSYTWTGEDGDGRWHTAGNWDAGGSYPGQNGNGDTATIGLTANVVFNNPVKGTISLARLVAGNVAGTTQRISMDWWPGELIVSGSTEFNAESNTQVEFTQGSLSFANNIFNVFPGDGYNRTFIVNDWIWWGHGMPNPATLHGNNDSEAYYNNRLDFQGLAGTSFGNLNIGPDNPSGAATNFFGLCPGRVWINANNTLTLRSAGTTLDISGERGYLGVRGNMACVASASGVPTVRLTAPSGGFRPYGDNDISENPAPITVYGQLFNSGVYPDLVMDASAITADMYLPLVALQTGSAADLADRWANMELSPNIVRLFTKTVYTNYNAGIQNQPQSEWPWTDFRILYALVKGTSDTFTWVDVEFDWQDGANATTNKYVAGDPLYALPPNPPPYQGRAFGGWFSLPDGQGTPITAASAAPGSDTAYYAYYAPFTEVRFDWQDGMTVTTNYYPEGMAFGTLPTPDRQNCALVGWFTLPDGGGTEITTDSTAPLAVAPVETYHALWTPTLAYWNKGAPVMLPDDSDWFIGGNWDLGLVPGNVADTWINKNGAVVNVDNDVTVKSLRMNPEANPGDPITLSIAQGKSLTVSGNNDPTIGSADNATEIILDIKGTLYNYGNTVYGRGLGSRVTFQGGGRLDCSGQTWFGNGTYYSKPDNPASLYTFTNITVRTGWNAWYGRCLIVDSLILANSTTEYAAHENVVLTFRNAVVTNSGGNVYYGPHNALGASILITDNSNVQNTTGGDVHYLQRENSTFTLTGGSTMTDSRPAGITTRMFFCQSTTNYQGGPYYPLPTTGSRTFIVDNATYTSTGTFQDIGGGPLFQPDVIGGHGIDEYFTNNWIIVRNNGSFTFSSTINYGTIIDVANPNGIEVDNATFTGGDLNLRNNSVLDIKGAGASVRLGALTCSDTTQDNTPTVKFTVPAENFSATPLTAGTLGAGMNLEIDVSAYNGRDRVPLIAVAGEAPDLHTTAFWASINQASLRGRTLKAEVLGTGEEATTLLSLSGVLSTVIMVK